MYILIALLLLGILITVHEAGHFFTARACGIDVEEFAIGMGPAIFTHQGRHAKFSLRIFPLGGFCAFYEEDDLEGKGSTDPRAFRNHKVWKRMLTVLMGPGMNFLLAFLVLFAYVGIGGITAVQPVIAEVEPGGPAELAGMRAGDRVIMANGQDMAGADIQAFLDMISAYSEGDAPIQLTVLREDGQAECSLEPFWDAELNRYRIGIAVSAAAAIRENADGSYSYVTTRATLGQCLDVTWSYCVRAGGAIVTALKNLVTTGEGLEETSGPVGIVSMVSQEVREGGLDAFINLLALISINLGIMNLLPIPGLDGSRFLFLVLEAVRGKPVPAQKEAIVHLCGMVLLIAAMLFFTWRDIMKLLH